MNHEQIRQVLDALSAATCYPEAGCEDKRYDEAIAILQAALAEPSEPVAWMWRVKPDSTIMKNKGKKCGVYFEDPKTIGIDIDSEAQKQNYEWSLLCTYQPSNQLDEIAKVLHYPDCWDTAAYPTLEDAIIEAKAWANCTNEDCQCPTKETP